MFFDGPESEKVLLVDASNVFNSLNRKSALVHVQFLHPLLTVLIICYTLSVDLSVNGTSLLTHDDTLAMPFYALATIPLIRNLSTMNVWQVLYADDSAVVVP